MTNCFPGLFTYLLLDLRTLRNLRPLQIAVTTGNPALVAE
jgi:hypothetical protein